MTIRKKFFVLTIVTIINALVLMTVYFVVNRRTVNLLKQDAIAISIIPEVNDFALLIADAVKDPGGNANLDWLDSYSKVSEKLVILNEDSTTASQSVLRGVIDLLRDVESSFTSLIIYNWYGKVPENPNFDINAVASQVELSVHRLVKEVVDLKTVYNYELIKTLQYEEAIFKGILFWMILYVFVAFYIIYQTIGNRIYTISEKLKNIRKKKFKVNLEYKDNNDEVDVLVSSVNVMLKQIRSDRFSLEKKVEERTQEIKQTKEFLEEIVNNIGDGLLVIDINNVVTKVNAKASELLGFGDATNKILGKTFYDVAMPKSEDGKSIKKIEKQGDIVKDGKDYIQYIKLGDAIYFTRQDGSTFPVSLTISRTDLGRIITFRDISEESKIDKAKSEFVTLASHQLRTPLSAISWHTEILLEEDIGKINKDQKNQLEVIYKSNRRMVELVEALLNVSRLEIGSFDIELEQVKAQELLEKVLSDLHIYINEKSLKIKTKYSKTLKKINTDRNLLLLTMYTIILNAIKYTPEKGSVTVGMRIVKSGTSVGGKVLAKESFVFEVKDTGYGIPKSEQKHIFTKLFRAENIKKFDSNGNGLGLYIIKNMLTYLDGKIWFKSQENKGTAFYVAIPLGK